eukprot:scaffold2693_cov91-Cylindrotheca_fusiformis.AAC.4
MTNVAIWVTKIHFQQVREKENQIPFETHALRMKGMVRCEAVMSVDEAVMYVVKAALQGLQGLLAGVYTSVDVS